MNKSRIESRNMKIQSHAASSSYFRVVNYNYLQRAKASPILECEPNMRNWVSLKSIFTRYRFAMELFGSNTKSLRCVSCSDILLRSFKKRNYILLLLPH